MALLFFHGVDTQVGSTATEAQNWDSGSMFTVNTGSRNGNQANYWDGASGNYREKSSLSISGSVVVGVGVKLGAATQGARDLISIKDGTTAKLTVGLDSADKLTLWLGDQSTGSLLGTGTTVLSASTWYFVEIKADVANGTAEVRLNDSAEITDASTGSSGSANAVRFGYQTTQNGVSGTNGDTFFDDYYIADTSGTGVVNNFVGSSAGVFGWDGDLSNPLGAPNAAGSSTQWTPDSGSNYARLREGTNDDDWSYVETSTTGHKDLYSFPDWSTGKSYVHSVKTTVVAKYASGSGSVRVIAARSGSTGNGATHTLGSTYAQFQDYMLTDPATASDWTQTNLNATEFGIEAMGGSPRVTLLRVEAFMSDTSFAVAATRRPNFVGFVGVP